MTFDSRHYLRLIAALTLLSLPACATKEERRSALVPSRSIALARKFDLVDVRAFIPDIAIDLRYATPHNVAGRPIYPPRMPCLLRVETATKLKTAQTLLRAQDYGLRIWDAYRPPAAQETLHSHGGHTGMFLSPKAGWSRHCGGIAIDLTLVDAQGREQRMPTYFDQDFAHASHHYRGSDPLVKHNLQILKDAMKQAGFTQLESEWWHFDDKDFINNPQPIIYARELGIPAM